MAQAGRLCGDLEQQRGLADAGLAGDQDGRAGDESAAQHPVELGHAAGTRQGVLDRDLPDLIDVLTVNGASNLRNSRMVIMDATGKRVMEGSLRNGQVDVSGLTSGVARYGSL